MIASFVSLQINTLSPYDNSTTNIIQGNVELGRQVGPSDVFVITFSDGSQIAITNYNDREAQDPIFGLQASVAGTDIVNLWLYGSNMDPGGSTFDVYRYAGGALGSLIYSYSDSTSYDAAIQFRYDTAGQILTIEEDDNPTGAGSYMGPLNSDGTLSGFAVDSSISVPVCYLRGTLIMTEHGEVPVEQLQPGDRVRTRFRGLQPVKWIGSQRFDGRLMGKGGAPVRFSPGSLGPNVPHTDLLVSPAHAMLIDDHLVAASLLVNDVTISQQACDGDIEYFHVELERHDCLLAAGAWGETYWENAGNRAHFHESRGVVGVQPDRVAPSQPTCLPLINKPNHPRLPVLRAAVTPRLTPSQLSSDPDLRLEAGTARIVLLKTAPNTWQGVIPSGLSTVRLRCRATRPSMVADVTDHRALGLCLTSIEIESAGGQVVVPLDHPALGRGFHDLERGGFRMWRWTDGDAHVPLWPFVDDAYPAVITIRGHHQPLNHVAPGELDVAQTRPPIRVPVRAAA